DVPGDPQPSQKWFESQLHDAMTKLDPARPVYVESESRRIGALQMPEALVARMHEGRRVTLVTPLAQRVILLKEEYAHYFTAPDQLTRRLTALTELRGKATVARRNALAAAADWDALVAELLEAHYDPAYARALERNFRADENALTIELRRASREGFGALARELRASVETGAAVTS